MEWGPHLRHLLRIEESGQRVPALDSMPMLDESVQHFWDAFAALDRSRKWGQGFPQAIQMTQIESYANMRAFLPDELDDLIAYVQHLDRVYLKRQGERKKDAGT